MKKICMLLAMLLCFSLVLCACGGQENNTTDPSDTTGEQTTTDSTENTDDGKVTYTVTVTDADGKPIAGAMVQLCKDACIPAVTEANGVATYHLAEDTYKVSFLSMPAGYTYAGEETEFYFEDGKTEMTIQLKAAE